MTEGQTNVHCWSRLWLAILVLFALNISNALAQNEEMQQKEELQFVVVGAEDRAPLASASAQWLGGKSGALSDLEGRVALPFIAGDTLRVGYIGYEIGLLPSKEAEALNGDTLFLKPQTLETEEIVVLPGENPAHRIIKCAIANKKRNDPYEQDELFYRAYNKLVVLPSPDDNQFFAFAENKEDSLKVDSVFREMQLLVWESVTSRYYQRPGKTKEIVEASRISGFKGLALPFSPTSVQDLSFYQNWLTILELRFASPLHQSATEKYLFLLQDTLYDDRDTIFRISFHPRKPDAQLLTGSMLVHTDGYALQHIEASAKLPVSEPLYREITVRQQCARFSDSIWLPTQMDADVIIDGDKLQPGSMEMYVRSTLRDVRLELEKKEAKFGPYALEVSPEAAELSDSILNKYRTAPLNAKESRTYAFMDSVDKPAFLTYLLANLNDLRAGRAPIGPVDLEIGRLIDFNPVEGFRFGAGLWTNRKLSKWFSLNGWAGYGLRDERWKFGGGAALHPFKNPQFRLEYAYARDLTTRFETSHFITGPVRPLSRVPKRPYSDRRYFFNLLDYTETHEASLYFPSFRNVSHALRFRYEHIDAAYDYRFNDKETFDLYEAEVLVRWTPGGEMFDYGGFQEGVRKFSPVVHARAFAGSLTESLAYDYSGFELYLQQLLPIGGNLKFEYALNAGWREGELPLQRRHYFQGNGAPNFMGKRYFFNTMPFQRNNFFIADRHAALITTLRIENQSFPSGKYAPDLEFAHAAGWGTLSETEIGVPGEDVAFRAPEHIYYEAGVRLLNIFPLELNEGSPIFGFLGLGFYCRYGAYSKPNFWENVRAVIEYNIALG